MKIKRILFFIFLMSIYSSIFFIIYQYYKINLLLKENIGLEKFVGLSTNENILNELSQCKIDLVDMKKEILSNEIIYKKIISLILRYIKYLIDKYGINNLPEEILNIIREYSPKLLELLPIKILDINNKIKL